ERPGGLGDRPALPHRLLLGRNARRVFHVHHPQWPGRAGSGSVAPPLPALRPGRSRVCHLGRKLLAFSGRTSVLLAPGRGGAQKTQTRYRGQGERLRKGRQWIAFKRSRSSSTAGRRPASTATFFPRSTTSSWNTASIWDGQDKTSWTSAAEPD